MMQPLGAASAASATRWTTAVYCTRTVQVAWLMLVWRVSFDQSLQWRPIYLPLLILQVPAQTGNGTHCWPSEIATSDERGPQHRLPYLISPEIESGNGDVRCEPNQNSKNVALAAVVDGRWPNLIRMGREPRATASSWLLAALAK
jgi:hypothetical protein